MRFVDVNAVFPGLHGLYTEGRPLIMIVVTQLHCEVLQHPFVIICLNFMIILSIIQPFIKINQNKPMLLIIQASIAQMMLFLAGGGGEGQHVLVAAAVDLLDSTQQRLAHACRGAPPPSAYYIFVASSIGYVSTHTSMTRPGCVEGIANGWHSVCSPIDTNLQGQLPARAITRSRQHK